VKKILKSVIFNNDENGGVMKVKKNDINTIMMIMAITTSNINY
jgi:hypothetical protein